MFLKKSTKGAIYFSLGSTLQSSDLGDQTRIFLEAIKQLKEYNFIWKLDVQDQTNLPSNLLIKEWLPQNRILGMSKKKLPHTKMWSDFIYQSSSKYEIVHNAWWSFKRARVYMARCLYARNPYMSWSTAKYEQSCSVWHWGVFEFKQHNNRVISWDHKTYYWISEVINFELHKNASITSILIIIIADMQNRSKSDRNYFKINRCIRLIAPFFGSKTQYLIEELNIYRWRILNWTFSKSICLMLLDCFCSFLSHFYSWWDDTFILATKIMQKIIRLAQLRSQIMLAKRKRSNKVSEIVIGAI